MGTLVDYFATSAGEALQAMELVGGPAGPGSPFSHIASVGIQPIPDLEGMVSRLPTISAGDRIEMLAETDSYEQVLMGIPESWRVALSSATDVELRAAAVEFRHAPENTIGGAPDVLTTDEGLADGLVAVGQLARAATTANLKMFCWVCM